MDSTQENVWQDVESSSPQLIIQQPTETSTSPPETSILNNNNIFQETEIWDPLRSDSFVETIPENITSFSDSCTFTDSLKSLHLEILQPESQQLPIQSPIQPPIQPPIDHSYHPEITQPQIHNINPYNSHDNHPPIIDPLGALLSPDPDTFNDQMSEPLEVPPTDDLNLPQYSFDISVTEPQKIGDTLNAHVTYKIKTTTNCPDYRNYEFSNSRRFSDFLWLFNQLTTRHTGIIVPPVPEKHALGRFQEEFVENRRFSLEKFITKVCSHHILQLDPDVKLFLESESFNADKRGMDAKGFIMGLMGDSTPAISSQSFLTIADADSVLETKKIEFEILERQLKSFQKALEAIIKQRTDLGNANYNFGENMQALATMETDDSLISNLNSIGNIHKEIKKLHEKQAKHDVYFLTTTVEEHIRVIASAKIAFNSRAKAYGRMQVLQAAKEKKSEQLERLKNTSKLRIDKLQIAQQEYDDAVDAHENSERLLINATELLKKECERVDHDKINDFSQNCFLVGKLRLKKMIFGDFGGFLNSKYFYILILHAFVVNRISSIAVPRAPSPLTPKSRILLRLPLIIALFYSSHLLYYSASVSDVEYAFSCFFILQCVSHAWDILTFSLENGSSALNSSESPNLVEWTLSYHYHGIKTPSNPLVQITFMHSIQLILVNILSLFGLSNYKLIPTTAVGIISIFHSCYCFITQRQDYPILFFFARFPEFIICCIIALVHVIYLFSKILIGDNVRPLSLHYPEYSEEFTSMLYKLGLSCLQTTRSLGLLNEMEPIYLPLAIGLTPEMSSSIIKSQMKSDNPLENHLEYKLNSDNENSKAFKPKLLLKLWMLSFGLLYSLSRISLGFFVKNVLGNRPVNINDKYEFKDTVYDEEDDEDYNPETDSDSDISDVSDKSIDSSDSCNQQEEPQQDTQLYQEIFNLAQDIKDQDAESDGSNIISSLISFMNSSNGITTRTRSKQLQISNCNNAILEMVIQEKRKNVATEQWWGFSSRNCVVCQTEARSIVLRPCGCLCLCDEGCRQSLAARKYRECPCCRRKIEGYSKIFEP